MLKARKKCKRREWGDKRLERLEWSRSSPEMHYRCVETGYTMWPSHDRGRQTVGDAFLVASEKINGGGDWKRKEASSKWTATTCPTLTKSFALTGKKSVVFARLK